MQEDESLEESKDKKSRNRYIRKLAQGLVSISENTIPVILKKIIRHIEDSKGVSIKCQGIDLKPSFSGQIIIYGSSIGIIYNSNHNRHRQRFTVAHEIGHFMLGHKFKVQEYNEIINFQTKSPIEKEANIFAAELLMPKDKLLSYIKSNSSETVEKLSYLFDVSIEAMWFKIYDDNLIKYFDHKKNTS